MWCASAALCGAFMWDRPPEAETRRILRIFDQYDRHMQSSFALVLDTRGVDGIDPRSLEVLFSWFVSCREALLPRIRLQASIIREGPIGFLLTGLLPVAGHTHPYRIFTDPAAAFVAVANDSGATLCSEVERIAERTRGVPRELQLLRALLAARVDVTSDEASRVLGMSARSLQRVLTRHGSSFRFELSAARFARAQDLLRSTEQKLAAISVGIGVSERSLTLLFRERTGLTPAEWRRRQRA